MLSLPRKFHWIAFAALLLLGGYLRGFAFFLPSNIGDPPSYQALAMKMNHGFMSHYNVLNYRMAPGEVPGTIDYVWENDPRKWTAMRTRASNRRPLNMQPPLLPTLMWLSHGVFKHSGPYTSVAQNLGAGVAKNPPWAFLRAQGYAIAVPFFFSLLGLAVVYLFCLRYFSWQEGLIALVLLAPSPLDLAVGTKLYSDGIVTTLAFSSLFLFLVSLEKTGRKALAWAAAAGLVLGLAFLAKLQGILFASGFVLASLLHPKKTAPWPRRLADPRLLVAGVLCFLVALPWNWLVYQTYGTPLPNTPQDPGNPWFRYVFGRPPYAYFLGTYYFMPASVLGWAYGLAAWLRPRRCFPESLLLFLALAYVLMMIALMKTGTAGLEHRYLMPIYPLLAVLSARALTWLWGKIRPPLLRRACVVLSVGGLLWLGWRAAQVGLQYSFRNLVTFAPWGL